MIRRYCAHPGCSTLVRKGRCARHRPKQYRDQDPEKRKLYDSGRWRGPNGIRERQLRSFPLCDINQRCDEPTVATHVHHIDGNTGNNQPSNLQSLCTACHAWIENQPGGALHAASR